MTDEPTCQGGIGLRNDRTCRECGDKYGSEEPPEHPELCPWCAYTAEQEGDQFGWFDE